MWNDRYLQPCAIWRCVAFKNIFPGAPAPPPAPAVPAVTPPPTMPDPFSPDTVAAQKQAMTQGMQAGRSSTVLTRAGATAGSTLAGSYGGSKLG